MPYSQHTFDNAEAVLVAAASALEVQRDAGRVPVLLVPSSAAALHARRFLADGSGAFGVRIETMESWVADRWELFGDGRRIVETGERELLLRGVLEEVSAGCETSVGPTPGTVALLARLAREALPQLLDAGRPQNLAAALSAAEREVLGALVRYAGALAERGLCELSQAAGELTAAMEEPPFVVLAGFDEVPCAFARMLDTLSVRTVVVRFDDGCVAPAPDAPRAPELRGVLERLFEPMVDEPLEPTGAVRFLLPAGRYAAAALIARYVVEAALREASDARATGRAALPVVVAARDPRALFDDVADVLADEGVRASVSARRAFADTAFGRAFAALLALAFDADYRVSQASDFALSTFSGIPWRTACDLDAAWRADRTVDRTHLMADLAAASEVAQGALEALAQGDVDGALAGFEARLRRRSDLDPAFRAEQLAAVVVARGFIAACVRTGARFLEARPLLERAQVSANASAAPASDPEDKAVAEVLFLSLSEVAERPACSCATLVVCDLTAALYPVRTSEDGATLLMEKTGLCETADALAQARHRFFRALSTARDAVVLERPLNTENADEAYPAVMYEELIDCYRSAFEGDGDIDRATGLPARLVPFAEGAGEEALQANLACALGAKVDAPNLTWDEPVSGEVSAALRARIVLPREGAAAGTELVLSPSAIESYLECPYKWFALRRLRLAEPDAGFGPLEMGSFSHGVLKSFYKHVREAGYAKVNAENLPAARVLLGETFDRHLAFQSELKRNCNPLIPRTKFEEAETADLKKKLVAYLDREAQLLPGFEPAHFEFEFGTAEDFPYAGFLLRGSIDRIDVNERGQAVVIDYKGSLTGDYALDSWSPAAQAAGAALPHKVQALVYAQVARRMLGLEVVGALYVSYGRDRRASGAVDRTVVGEQDVPGLDMEACGVPGPAAEALGVRTFDGLVDAVEERIALAARTLSAGLIGPDPRGLNPCGYCPVLACERRRES